MAAASLGCAGNVTASDLVGSAGSAGSASTSEARTGAASTALVVVERTSGPGESHSAEAVARFVRARGASIDGETLRLAGATTAFPPMGTCATLDSIDAVDSAPSARPGVAAARAIELVDVGSVELRSGDVTIPLQARRLPDVTDLVSGVFYARAAETDALPSRGTYQINVSGAPDDRGPLAVSGGPFVVTASAPGEPSDVKVAVREGTADVDVSWSRGAVEDFVYLDVAPKAAPGSLSGAGSIRCLVSDSGHVTLGAADLGTFDEGTLGVHRVHREPFRVKGADAGEVRFDFARVVSVARH